MFSFVATVRNHSEQAMCGNKTVLIERGLAFGFTLFYYYYLRVRFGLPINDYAIYLINNKGYFSSSKKIKGYFESGGLLLSPSNSMILAL